MSGSFEGFSEEYIQRIHTCDKPTATNKTNAQVKPQQGFVNTRRNLTATRRVPKTQYSTKISNITQMEPELEKAKLCKTETIVATQPVKLPEVKSAVAVTYPEVTFTAPVILHNGQPPESNGALNKVEIQNFVAQPNQKIDLEQFQARQKLMEEQNRKRKELLAKLLAVKTKQTKEEAKRLNEINDELKKLDLLLSNDVNILRQQIEVASLDYMEVQKRYFKIERDFLEVKVLLHQKLERKELLTEHLCSIIEKNEERKAQKLTELLEKLNVNAESSNKLNGASIECAIENSECLNEDQIES